MKTFELTYSIKTIDDSDIDMSVLEGYLSEYENTDMELIELDLVEPAEAVVVFSLNARSISDCPDELELLNDETIVDDPSLYVSERILHSVY